MKNAAAIKQMKGCRDYDSQDSTHATSQWQNSMCSQVITLYHLHADVLCQRIWSISIQALNIGPMVKLTHLLQLLCVAFSALHHFNFVCSGGRIHNKSIINHLYSAGFEEILGQGDVSWCQWLEKMLRDELNILWPQTQPSNLTGCKTKHLHRIFIFTNPDSRGPIQAYHTEGLPDPCDHFRIDKLWKSWIQQGSCTIIDPWVLLHTCQTFLTGSRHRQEHTVTYMSNRPRICTCGKVSCSLWRKTLQQ